MAASNRRRRAKRPAIGWRLFVNGRLVLGATTLEALAKCTAIEGARRAADREREGHPPTVLINSFDEWEDLFGPLNGHDEPC
jgi:hypothetical protein